MREATNRRLVLVERPLGPVGDEHFEMRTGPVPELGDDQVLVETVWIGFDPTQRGWLNDVPSYMPPVGIGEVMRASGVGRVVASRNPGFVEGEWVSGLLGWQDYSVQGPGVGFGLTKVPDGAPPQAMLGVFGTTGITAYFGMLDVARPKPGDTVFVSGAAGATGSVAAQIAKLQGCTVIGSAGGTDKCRWVTERAGLDACIDYRSEDVSARLGELAPKGLDVYFDNVGGPTLEAALDHIAQGARVTICGAISSGYDMDELPPGPRNYMQLVIKRARMEGFLVIDYIPRFAEAIAALAGWVAEGKIVYEEQVAEGLENCPATLRGLFEGANLGKQLLKVRDDAMADHDRMETLSEAIDRLRGAGYRADWVAGEGGLHCGACGTVTSPEHVTVEEVVRFEGVSDPDDESILVALAGDCGHHGLYAAPYGPDATPDDATVMRGLQRR